MGQGFVDIGLGFVISKDEALEVEELKAKAIGLDRFDGEVEHLRTEKVTLLKVAEETGCTVTLFIDELHIARSLAA